MPANRKGFIVDLPKPFWGVLGREPPPRTYHDFRTGQRVAVAADSCGCLIVRSKEWNQRRISDGQCTDGRYVCPVCNQAGGRNVQEVDMLQSLKRVVADRAEAFVVCVQMPLQNLRCDVVLVPVHATRVQQLVVVELDGVDHAHKPRQYGKSFNESFNAAVQRDNTKEALVRREGMQFMRIDRSELNHEHQPWIQSLNRLLNTHVGAVDVTCE